MKNKISACAKITKCLTPSNKHGDIMYSVVWTHSIAILDASELPWCYLHEMACQVLQLPDMPTSAVACKLSAAMVHFDRWLPMKFEDKHSRLWRLRMIWAVKHAWEENPNFLMGFELFPFMILYVSCNWTFCGKVSVLACGCKLWWCHWVDVIYGKTWKHQILTWHMSTQSAPLAIRKPLGQGNRQTGLPSGYHQLVRHCPGFDWIGWHLTADGPGEFWEEDPGSYESRSCRHSHVRFGRRFD